MNYVLYDHKRDMVTEIGVPQKKRPATINRLSRPGLGEGDK